METQKNTSKVPKNVAVPVPKATFYYKGREPGKPGRFPEGVIPFILTFPDNPLKMFQHSEFRPHKMTLEEPDDWPTTTRYTLWVKKCRAQLQ